MIKDNKNQSVSDRFYWEVPGDVPGRRSQPKAFTDTDSSSDHNEQQHPSDLSTDERQSDRVVDTPEQLIPEQQIEDTELKVTAHSSQEKSPPQPHSRPKLLNMLPVFISLLLILVFLGTDDLSFYSDHSKNVAVAAVEAPPADKPVIASYNPEAAQPTIIVLSTPTESTTGHTQGQLRVITHVVVKGDTLWHIAQTYLKDPFRYPELAALSKINNPDLIYPNEIVHIHVYESSLALLKNQGKSVN